MVDKEREQFKLWKAVNWAALFNDKELWTSYVKIRNELYGAQLVPNRADRRRLRKSGKNAKGVKSTC